MRPLVLSTNAGRFRLRGRLHVGPDRPALMIVTGAFPRDDAFDGLVTQFSGASVLIADLPGMGTPWSDAGVSELRQALQDVIARLLGDAPLVLMGASTGNLLTLGLGTPNLRRCVALEPFLSTAPLWPFRDWARQYMAENPQNAGVASYLWRMFGFAPDTAEDRDYRAIAASITAPTDVIVGRAPLEPPRDLAGWPSLTSAEDRAALNANPLVTLHEGRPGSGHGLAGSVDGEALIKSVTHAALLDAVGR